MVKKRLRNCLSYVKQGLFLTDVEDVAAEWESVEESFSEFRIVKD